MKKFLAVIPARGGSKRIPNKNIKLFNGKPLIFYTIKQALNSKLFDRIVVDTDNKKIAQIAKKYGARVFIHPEGNLYSNWVRGMHKVKGKFFF